MPARNSKRSSVPDKPLATEEWDFRACSDEELACCCYYEYARMSPTIKDRVEQLRATDRWDAGLYPGAADYYPDAWFRTFFRNLSEFPDTPWLQIPVAKRREVREACAKIQGPFVAVGPERYFNEEEQYPYYPTDIGMFSLRSVHAVEVDWTASDEAILAAFVRWRDANRPSHEVILESRGRGGARELLKFLGTYRLMQHFANDSDAAGDWVEAHAPKPAKGKENGGVPRYSDQAAWRKAASKAKRLIDAGVGSTPASMLEGKLQASNMSTVQRARVTLAIEEAKKKERGQATLARAERVLARAKEVATRSAKKGN